MRNRLLVGILGVLVVMLSLPAMAGADSLVTNGSPASPFPQNKQNEPSVAIDPHNPSLVAAGSNDEIDLAPCDGPDCPFTPGVGVSGIYFSFDGGSSWIQPSYTGWSARTGTPGLGPIGTLPHYYEHGLVSAGDPGLAWGPAPGPNGFSWSNGDRLYYSNLAANFNTIRQEQTFRGFEAIAVSHSDDAAAAAANDAGAWSDPAIVTQRRQSSTTFSDKPAIGVDNVASSPFFGNAYVCYTQFRGQETVNGFPEPIFFSRSTDGGNTWSKPQQLSPAFDNARRPGRQGCDVATDSQGVVYVVWEDTAKSGSVFKLAKSFDGGKTFGRPRIVAHVVDVGAFDNVRSISFDGIAGARTSSFPSLSIANGSPSGTGAPDTVVLGWSDGAEGLNGEHALVQLSADGGRTWTDPVRMEQSGDRPDFAFVSISPNGEDLYVVYDAFLDPFRSDTTSSRRFQGVVRHADVSGTALANKATLDRGAVGDARASSANALIDEFIGDYNTVDATNAGAVAVYNDASNGAVCSAINAYRASVAAGSPISAPAPATDCPATFGNTDIFGAVLSDPTP